MFGMLEMVIRLSLLLTWTNKKWRYWYKLGV